MRSNLIIGIALAALMAIFLISGLGLFAMVLFQVPIAYYWLDRKEVMALGMICTAVLVPAIIAGSLPLGLIFGVMASFGLLLGILARRQTSIGITILVLTTAMYMVAASLSIAEWNDVCADFSAGIEQYKSTVESQNDEEVAEKMEAIISGFAWVENNLLYIYFGGLFSSILLLAAAITGTIYRRIKPVASLSTVNYQFIWMRTPELMVWIAIAIAGLWFLDNRWPNEVVRFIAWNGGIALAAIYWLNGLSIVFFIWRTRNWSVFLLYIVMFFMIICQVIHTLSIIGFFDTWIDFRRRLVREKPSDTSDNENDSNIE